MNYWWLVSGIIGLITAFIHLIGGHFDPIKPFLKSDLAPIPKATLHACWHMVTIILFLSAFELIYLGIKPSQRGGDLLAMFVGIQFVGFSIVFLIISFSGKWKNKLFALPQWTLLLPVGVISIVGSIVK